MESCSLLDGLIEIQSEVDTARRPLVRFFNNPQNADINTLESAFKENQELCKKARLAAIHVNKRIEELLIGEPSN
ncbi:unnamed protein product [marine sediment metagenome]|uniref:Uncharacterized protein n=1 Tax=marine sediment metagenome TaxID=412755 RepID=X1R0S5_9ZZZZ